MILQMQNFRRNDKFKSDLKGEQEGEYRMDIKTGMLKSCEVHSKVKGQIQAMGRDIPVTIIAKTNINKFE